MSEEKAVTPAYNRVGICEECGADVYAIKGAAGGGGQPLMSACSCAGERKFLSLAEGARMMRARRSGAAAGDKSAGDKANAA